MNRPAWKNLVFTGGQGSGKSRTAAAVARAYRALGVLSSGHLIEVAASDLVAPGADTTSKLVREVTSRATGGVLLISDVHVYARQHERGQQVLRLLHDVLTDYRNRECHDLAVILARQAAQIRTMFTALPAFATRFPWTIDFPDHSPRSSPRSSQCSPARPDSPLRPTQGTKLVPCSAERPATRRAAVLGSPSGRLTRPSSARPAVSPPLEQPSSPSAVCSVRADDIPDCLQPKSASRAALSDDKWPVQYL